MISEKEASQAARNAASSLADTSARVRAARLLADFASAAVLHLERAKTTGELEAKSSGIEAVRKELAIHRSALAELPEITAASLNKLRKVDFATRESENTLAAIATGIELLSSDLTIRLDGETLLPDSPRVVTDSTELHIGGNTRIRINPGGGNSLKSARENAERSRAELQSALEKLTVTSLDEAAEIQSKRQTLEQKIETTRARLQAIGSAEITDQLAEVSNARDAASADLNRRHQALAEPREIPKDLPAARALQQTAVTGLESALEAEKSASQAHDSLQAALTKSTETRATHQQSIEASRQKHSELKIQAATLAESFGQAPERKLAITAAATKIVTLQTTATATSEALAKLDPETLANDRPVTSGS